MTSIYPHLLTFYLCLILVHLCSALDQITPTKPLKDPETLLSNSGDFRFGFFSPPNTTNRYLGIWYNKASTTDYVWVANRNNPVNDSSSVLSLSKDGNLQLSNRRNDILWSSGSGVANHSLSNNTSIIAQLLDSGNFVVLAFNADNAGSATTTNGTNIWQSFDHPTDSVLPNMKLVMIESDVKEALRAWNSYSDPSFGRFTLGVDSFTHPQVVVWDRNKTYWRSGPWNGNIFLGLLYYDSSTDYANTFIRENGEGEVDLFYTGAKQLAFSHYKFSHDGTIGEAWWDPSKKMWQEVWAAPSNACDFYGKCGAFGTCNPTRSPICQCVKGFDPKNAEEWKRENWSNGCARRIPLNCGNTSGPEDGFLRLKMVKIPDNTEWVAGLTQVECNSQCLKNCSCLAYAYDAGAGCMYWSRDLIDIQEFSAGGIDLCLRVPESLLGNSRRRKVVIAVAVIVGVAALATLVYLLYRWIGRRKGKTFRRKQDLLADFKYGDHMNKLKFEELPLFEVKKLSLATNNFQESNKLGQGGFGPVYGGRLEDGREIAVKRLSAVSGQGLEEFMNEVMLISGLQHRNLVRLLGCCVDGGEKMLIYEYMPNKSLDAFLFDPLKRDILDWKKRFNIIEGICRGLLYLHRDSRLKIIHRDLKASNILLDEGLNPKISDFGMARIIGDNQDQDDTKRVVGTYGYMSPEYAMEGRFSEKSDVFSFGVLILEIVTGKKNNNFWFDEQSLTLLGYTWKLWNEDDIVSVIDPTVLDPSFQGEILKCIQVGLLCVQEIAKDRPNITTVMSMLSNDIADLPFPKQPGFTKRQVPLTATSSSQQSSSTQNYVSVTHITGR